MLKSKLAQRLVGYPLTFVLGVVVVLLALNRIYFHEGTIVDYGQDNYTLFKKDNHIILLCHGEKDHGDVFLDNKQMTPRQAHKYLISKGEISEESKLEILCCFCGKQETTEFTYPMVEDKIPVAVGDGIPYILLIHRWKGMFANVED